MTETELHEVLAMVKAGWRCPERHSTGRGHRCNSTTNPRRVSIRQRSGSDTGKTELRCATHAGMHERRARKFADDEMKMAAVRAAVRAARRETESRRNYATNVATMLAQAIAAQSNLIGVSFEVSYDGRELKMSTESGEKLLRWLT